MASIVSISSAIAMKACYCRFVNGRPLLYIARKLHGSLKQAMRDDTMDRWPLRVRKSTCVTRPVWRRNEFARIGSRISSRVFKGEEARRQTNNGHQEDFHSVRARYPLCLETSAFLHSVEAWIDRPLTLHTDRLFKSEDAP